MTNEVSATAVAKLRPAMTPLWVISLFVSLTEVVAGLAVGQATGLPQAALVAFVIAFPLLVAAAFFAVLWRKPYVFYPPSEFGSGVAVADYVEAMGASAPLLADLEADVSKVRAETHLDLEALRDRMETLEALVARLAVHTKESERALEEYRSAIATKSVQAKETRAAFERKSENRVHVISVTHSPPSGGQTKRVDQIASALSQLGYRTSTGALGSYFYLRDYADRPDWIGVRVIHPDGNRQLANEVIEVLRDDVDMPIEVLTASEALSRSAEDLPSPDDADVEDHLNFLPTRELDLTVAVCMR